MKINTLFGTICIGCYTGNTVGLTSSLTLPATTTNPSTVSASGSTGMTSGATYVIPGIPGIKLDTAATSSQMGSGAGIAVPAYTYYVGSRIFTFSATNLKPSTAHTWSFAGQTGTVTTDKNGAVTFTVTFNPGNGTYSTLAAALSTINGLVGGVNMNIYNLDNTSSASCTVQLIAGGDTPKANPTAPIIPVTTGGGPGGRCGPGKALYSAS
jgi:hypothetical protein